MSQGISSLQPCTEEKAENQPFWNCTAYIVKCRYKT